MGQIVVLAEKPSVARDIARVLGANQRADGCLSGNGYTVTWAVGHLVTLKEPEEIDERYKRWRAEDLPILPECMELKVVSKTRSQFKIVKALINAKDTDRLICATDSGREGELIFRYIYQMAGCKKPFDRLWISSMTDEAIREGFARLQPGAAYNALYQSAKCRSEADWLVGMNASRAFTLRYGVLLSVGRVQTPTLQMLVKRRLEIDRFVPQPYFIVRVDFGDYQGLWFNERAQGEKTHIPTREQAEAIAAQVQGKEARVLRATSEEKRDLPPQLYDLTTLQREASNLLGFTADKTLKTAQNLYEKHKLITYPRTDSRYLSHDMGPSVHKALSALGDPYAALAAPVLEHPIPQLPRVFDDARLTDHHAIIPTGKRLPTSLTQDEQRLFDLIARRLIAAFYPPHLYQALRVVTGCEGHTFLSNGRIVTQEGYKAVYRDLQPRKIKKEKDDEAPLPVLHEGDVRTVRQAHASEEKTQPPKEHTDASLLSEMEHAGRRIEDETLREAMKACSLGTPATRAAIIERLIAVGYAKRKGRQILATPKGVQLISAVPPEIASPETTGRWEQALERIARGEGGDARFMEGITRLSTFLTEFARSKAPEVAFEHEEKRGRGRRRSAVKDLGIPCPLCGTGKVTQNEKAFGCTRWREGCTFTIWKDGVQRRGGPEMTEKLLRALLEAPDKRLHGSTGMLEYRDGRLTFTPRN